MKILVKEEFKYLKKRKVVRNMKKRFTIIKNIFSILKNKNIEKFLEDDRWELKKIYNDEEFQTYFNKVGKARCEFEQQIAQEGKDLEKWYMSGYCQSCGIDSKFLLDWNYSNGTMPNFRERLVCKSCNLNSRQRFMVGYLKKLSKNKKIKDVYLYEQITDFYDNLKGIFKDFNIVGSEYLGWEKKSSQVINGIRHEDALNLSFKNESFDVIISNDVFEHVPDIKKTIKEAYRVLRKNGFLIISIPFTNCKKTVQRAIMKNGSIKHLLVEQYHGNPLSEKGSLVFYDFGWDFLDVCKNSGFEDVHMLGYYSSKYSYIGNGLQYIFIAKK